MVEPSVFVVLVKLQRRLLQEFGSLHPEFAGKKWLVGVPFNEELRLDKEIWDVTRHGVGLMFKRREPIPNIVVDVHVDTSNPNLLDAWRLQQFFESAGGTLEFDDADKLLKSGSDTGSLVMRGGGRYELID